MVASHRHIIMLVNVIVWQGVIGGPVLAEWAEPCRYPIDSIGTRLVATLHGLLSMKTPKAHQACVTKSIGIIVGIILATGMSYYHHDIENGYNLLVWKLLGTRHCRQGC